MNILIDVGHPAHVHLFKNFISEAKQQGHKISISTRRVTSIIQLLHAYGLDYEIVGKKRDGIIAKYLDQIEIIFNILKLSREKKIDYALGVSMVLPIVSRFRKMAVFGFDDDDMSATPTFAKYVNKSDVVLTPDALKNEQRGENHVAYSGYHELAYLHPNRFIPDESVLFEAGLKKGEKYFVLRFNAFKAHHDTNAMGISLENKRRLIEKIQKYGKVFITSERELEPEFESLKISIAAHKIHSFIYYSTMFIGDSQTMTTEAALLGVPAFKCNSFANRLSIPNEIEQKYRLCYSFLPMDFDKMLLQIDEVLSLPDIKLEWGNRIKTLLDDKIDVTAFLYWLVSIYPNSLKEFKKNSQIQYRFK
jgi:predicted glycosyltransferase